MGDPGSIHDGEDSWLERFTFTVTLLLISSTTAALLCFVNSYQKLMYNLRTCVLVSAY